MLKQNLQLKLLQKLSPQQIQLMKLLQIPTMALEQRIKEELQENPALEEGEEVDQEELSLDDYDSEQDDVLMDNSSESIGEDGGEEMLGEESETITVVESEKKFEEVEDYFDDDEIPYYKLSANNSSPDDERYEAPIVGTSTFQDGLYNQLGTLSLAENQLQVAEYIIGNLDDDGYLRRPIASIIDDLAFSQNIFIDEATALEVLAIIQTLDPPGIAARDLKECLAIQLRKRIKEQPDNVTAPISLKIIEGQMEEFSKKHYEKIARHLHLDDPTLKSAIGEILKLNPRPADTASDSTKSSMHVIPDFIITNNDGTLELHMHSQNVPPLRVSPDYKTMQEEYSRVKATATKTSKEALHFVKQKIDAAKWFIEAINQRQQTLYLTMSAILQYQYDYFLSGDETKLKPMILKDIAETIGLDISTVSRVANSKYVQTPFGTFLLKTFFSEALQTDSGEEVSSREVKKILSEAVSSENKLKPITDDELANVLKNKGYNIARRTVAKYREQLNIPVARLRKQL